MEGLALFASGAVAVAASHWAINLEVKVRQRTYSARAHARLAHYFSTACSHERHGDCRGVCKWCTLACRCRCHDTPPRPSP